MYTAPSNLSEEKAIAQVDEMLDLAIDFAQKDGPPIQKHRVLIGSSVMKEVIDKIMSLPGMNSSGVHQPKEGESDEEATRRSQREMAAAEDLVRELDSGKRGN